MARRPNEFIELSGPLFDQNAIRNFKGAVAGGIQDLADDGVEILQSFIHQAGFIDSGGFVSSVDAEFVQSRGIGYAKVYPKGQWPVRGRPTRTWYEKGVRRGVKLRKAGGGFAKTKTRLRQMSFERYFAEPIRRVLN